MQVAPARDRLIRLGLMRAITYTVFRWIVQVHQVSSTSSYEGLVSEGCREPQLAPLLISALWQTEPTTQVSSPGEDSHRVFQVYSLEDPKEHCLERQQKGAGE